MHIFPGARIPSVIIRDRLETPPTPHFTEAIAPNGRQSERERERERERALLDRELELA